MPSENRARRPKISQDLDDPDLRWFLQDSAAACGFHGFSMEPGISQEPNTHPYNDHQLGWGNTVSGSIGRARQLWQRWQKLAKLVQDVAAARYALIGKPDGSMGLRVAFGELSGVALYLALTQGYGGQTELARVCEEPGGKRNRARIQHVKRETKPLTRFAIAEWVALAKAEAAEAEAA